MVFLPNGKVNEFQEFRTIPALSIVLCPSLVLLVNTPAEAYGFLYKNRLHGMMPRACNPRTWKLEVGGGPQV